MIFSCERVGLEEEKKWVGLEKQVCGCKSLGSLRFVDKFDKLLSPTTPQ